MSRPDTWMPLYHGDYLKSTMHLTTEQHGAYLLLQMAAWTRGGRLPADESQLAAICRADRAAWRRIRAAVLGFFRDIDGELFHEQIGALLDKAAEHIAKQKANGKRGGRPKQTQEKPMGFVSDNPNQSPSTSTSTSEEHKPKIPTSTTEPHQGSDRIPSSSSGFDESRAKSLAGQLIALELERGKRISASPADQRIVAWTVAGITAGQLREAWKEAVYQRECDHDQSPVNVGFLDVFIAKQLAPNEAQSVVTTRAKEWHETASGIEAKGRELGIDGPSPLTGGFPAFRARVFAAAGLVAQP